MHQPDHVEASDLVPEDDGPIVLRKSKLEDSEMDIAPMIDCTFLLLIFFIVCSHIGQQAGVDLPQARFGVAVASKASVIITVAPGDGDLARVFKGDSMSDNDLIAGATVAEQEDAVAQYVAETLEAEDSSAQHVLIKAARGLKHREVSRIARAAVRSAEVTQLFVAVMDAK